MALSQKVILEIEAQIGKATQNFKAMDTQIKQLTSEVSKLQKQLDAVNGKTSKPKSPINTQEVKRGNDELKKTNSLLEQYSNRVGSLVKGAIFTAATVSLVRLGKQAIQTGFEFNSMIESANAAFTVMAGGAENASMLMGQLTNLSMRSSIALDDAANSAKQLLAYGFEVGGITKNMEMLGTITAATGGRLDDLAYVYGTLRTQNKAYARDLMQFAMRGVPIYEELGKVMGMSTEDMVTAIKKGKIDIYFKDVEKAFQNMTKEGGAFFGMMQSRLNTVGGAQDQFNKRLQMMLGAMMSEASPAFVNMFKTLTGVLGDSEGSFRNIGKQIGEFINKFTASLPGMIDGVVKLAEGFATLANSLEPVIGALMNISQLIGNIAGGAGIIFGGPDAIRAKMGGAGPSTQSTNPGERMSAIQAGMTFDPTRSVDFQKWFIASFQKDKLTFEMVSKYAEQFKVSTKEVADAALDAGYISKDKWQEFMQLMMEVPKMVPPFLNQFQNGLNSAIGMAGKIKNPYDELRGMFKSTGSTMLDILYGGNTKEFLKESGIWTPESAPDLSANSATINALKANAGGVSSASMASTYTDNIMKEINGMISQIEKIPNPLTKALFKEEKLGPVLDSYIKQLTDDINTAFAKGFTVEDASVKALMDTLEKLLKMQEKPTGGATKDLGPFWLPREAEVAASLDAIDDIVLSKDKAIYEAKKDLEARGLKETDTLYQQTIKNIGIYWARQIENTKREQIAALKNLQASNATNLARLSGDQMKIIQKEYDEAITAEENAYKIKMENIDATKKEELQAESDRHEIAMKMLRKERDEKVRNAKIAIFDKSVYGGLDEMINRIKASAVDVRGNLTNKAIPAAAGVGALQGLQGSDVGAVAGGFAQGGWIGAIAAAVGQFVGVLMDSVKDMDGVKEMLNPIKTIAKAINPKVFEMFASTGKLATNMLGSIAKAISPLLAIVVALTKVSGAVIDVAISMLMPVIETLAEVFAWLYNKVIVPIGNMWIGVMNGIINGVNSILKFINEKLGTKLSLIANIDPLPLIDFSETAAEAAESLKKTTEAMQIMLTDSIDYLTQKLKDTIDRDMETTKQLFEVGAISIAEYEKRVADAKALVEQANPKYIIPGLENITDPLKMLEMINALKAQQKKIEEGVKTQQEANTILSTIATLTGNTVTELQNVITAIETSGKLATSLGGTTTTVNTGTGVVSSDAYTSTETPATSAYDVAAAQKIIDEIKAREITAAAAAATVVGIPMAIAQGVIIQQLKDQLKAMGVPGYAVGAINIPQDHMAMVHQGEMIVPERFADGIRNGSMSLGSNSGGGDTIIVNVGGSIITENKLADLLAERLYTRRSRGAVSV